MLLQAISALLVLGMIVLAMLVMFRAINLSDIFLMTRRGLIAAVAFLVLGCLAKGLLFGIILPFIPHLVLGVGAVLLALLVLLFLFTGLQGQFSRKNRRAQHGDE